MDDEDDTNNRYDDNEKNDNKGNKIEDYRKKENLPRYSPLLQNLNLKGLS